MHQLLVNERFRFEIFNLTEKRFLSDEEKARLRVALTSHGYVYLPGNQDCVMVHYTNIIDDNGKQLLEGDIVTCYKANEFGSMSEIKGIIRYCREERKYTIDVFTDDVRQIVGAIDRVEYFDNSLLNPQLAHEISIKQGT